MTQGKLPDLSEPCFGHKVRVVLFLTYGKRNSTNNIMSKHSKCSVCDPSGEYYELTLESVIMLNSMKVCEVYFISSQI